MRIDLLGFAISTSVALLALGCGRNSLGLGAGGGSGGSGSGVGGSGKQGNGRHGGMSGSGGLQAGGMTSPGGTDAICPGLPCPANPCPEGEMGLALFDCDCSGPCGCWQCVPVPGFGTGGARPSGGTSGSSGSGGIVSLGGVSGSSGKGSAGGASGSGGSSVTCIQPPCGTAVCPYGDIIAPSSDCDCSGPCGCPCGCWTCVPASESPDASTHIDAVPDGPSMVGDAKVPLNHRSTQRFARRRNDNHVPPDIQPLRLQRAEQPLGVQSVRLRPSVTVTADSTS
jgi:hypothetical protein